MALVRDLERLSEMLENCLDMVGWKFHHGIFFFRFSTLIEKK